MCKIMAKMHLLLFAWVIRLGSCSDVIYRLSPEEYIKMPQRVQVDRYWPCLLEPSGVYCTAVGAFVSDGPSELLDMMQGYSMHSQSHFNHTKFDYGKCVTQNCRKFYNGTSLPALQGAVEACLNESVARDYGLKTKVYEITCYHADGSSSCAIPPDWVDWAAAALLIAFVALNVAGTVYDSRRDQTQPGNKYFLAFSWRANWRQLMAPPSTDPRASRLQAINGVRFLTCLVIVFIHLIPLGLLFVEDMYVIEKLFKSRSSYAFISGNILTQTFFVISGFLLVYNTLVSSEKKPLTPGSCVRSIILRYIRLATITNATVLAMATWMRFVDYGPLWQLALGRQMEHCRKYWIYNLLLINDYVGGSLCAIHTWSSACDFHMHVLGLSVMLLAPTTAKRRSALAALLVIGLILPAITVVVWDSDGSVFGNPESALIYWKGDASFHKLYKPMHNNLPNFIMGMILGEVIYAMQKKDALSRTYAKYRYAYWMLLPAIYAIIWLPAYLNFQEGPRRSLWLRVLTTLCKPTFGLILALILCGASLRIETVYRRVLEWRGFVPLAKLSFCIYTLHVFLLHVLNGSRVTLMYFSPKTIVLEYMGLLGSTMILSLVVYMGIEAPTTRIAKLALAEPPAPAQRENDAKTE